MADAIGKRELIELLIRWIQAGIPLGVIRQSAGETCRVMFVGSLSGNAARLVFSSSDTESPASVSFAAADVKAVAKMDLGKMSSDAIPDAFREVTQAFIAGIPVIGFELQDGGMLAVVELSGETITFDNMFRSVSSNNPQAMMPIAAC